MALVLQITSGARAGQREEFTRPVVLVGRHTESDLKFDVQKDLDVSTRHAEFRSSQGGWTVQDLGSTNGTFVNGQRVARPQAIRAGDAITFGLKGPRIEVVATGSVADAAPRTELQTPLPGAPRPKTEERIAIAVAAQTSSMKKLIFGLAAVVVVAIGVMAYLNRQATADSRRVIALLQAQNDSLASVTAGKAAGVDSAIREIMRQRDQMAASIRAGGDVNQSQIDMLTRRTRGVMSAAAVDWSPIRDKNNSAVAYVVVRTHGDSAETGTAFGITPGGLLVTNKHVVVDRAGNKLKDIVITFADVKDYHYCRIVSIADGDVDLAFIQINDPGIYPVVEGIAANPAVRVGEPLGIIGFPLGTDLPMEGSGLKLIPRTTLGLGFASKSLPDDLQLDAFAAEGSSGSPVFNARGLVVGVVYGGNRQSAGRVVFAVPGAKLLAALPASAKSIVKQ